MTPNYKLTSDDALTVLTRKHNLHHWKALVLWVKQLPYGRHHNRKDFSLVLSEQKGTCSSKHAFLKKIADLNNIPNVKLMLCIYKMNSQNTPNIGTVLKDNGLEYIPEAHCFLNSDGTHIDATTAFSSLRNIKADIVSTIEITAEHVSEFKISYHRAYMAQWLEDTGITLTLEDVWGIREQCIANLE